MFLLHIIQKWIHFLVFINFDSYLFSKIHVNSRHFGIVMTLLSRQVTKCAMYQYIGFKSLNLHTNKRSHTNALNSPFHPIDVIVLWVFWCMVSSATNRFHLLWYSLCAVLLFFKIKVPWDLNSKWPCADLLLGLFW